MRIARSWFPRCGLQRIGLGLCGLVAAMCLERGGAVSAFAEETPAASAADAAYAKLPVTFQQQVQPLLTQYCVSCHNAEEMQSGIRLDQLDGHSVGRRMNLFKGIVRLLSEREMPPADAPQPADEQRMQAIDWIDAAIRLELSRERDKNGSVRRLTVAQYRNTLRDLLGIEDDLTQILPPDAVSKDGFVNNGESLALSPLLVEAYFRIAEEALGRCIVDESTPPEIQSFRVELGAAINAQPSPDNLVLGALSHLLRNEDFTVSELAPEKPFDYVPRRMRTKYRFIEGYQGNDTVRGWRDFDSIYHAVFACMRGTDGYPKGLAYEAIDAGLLLRPAIPSAEIFQVESTYGPRANFKISLRELPDQGRFRITVRAARYADALLLDAGTASQERTSAALLAAATAEPQSINVEQAGIYQVDIHPQDAAPESRPLVKLSLASRHFSGTLEQPAFLAVRLSAGPLDVSCQIAGALPAEIVLTRLADDHAVTRQFLAFEKRVPRLGVHLGLRRDCGSTLTRVAAPQSVASCELQDYVFEGAITNYPSPDVEKDNVNYLAGIREIGVRSEYTDGRDMPRLVIRSVEFEGPFYESWPPPPHRQIFIASEHRDDPPAYAREILSRFATRAFRRPLAPEELEALLRVWQQSYAGSGDFQRSVQDALLVVLTSPQFLLLIESSSGPQAERLDPYELAAKLSYFLWNTAPDERLLSLAASDQLHDGLDGEITRMLADPRFGRFAREFTSQWLSLDKLDVVAMDRERYPRLTRDVRQQLREEPVQFLSYLVRENLPVRHLVESEFVVANEVVASYYGLGERTDSGFEFVALSHQNEQLGGLLTQAGILAGLSNGRESNPVKRGAWLARKIIAEPPEDPPPNVPALPEDDGAELTLREKLERHREQPGCAKCHEGIDPWGLPLEQFDAGGMFKKNQQVEASSILPDGTQVDDANGLKEYLAHDRIDQVAFSFLKHLATYATGRTLTYNEIELLRAEGLELKPRGYRMQDMVRWVVHSELFLAK